MPTEMKLKVNPAFKPESKEDKDQFEVAKKVGDKVVTYQTAVEAVRLSKGMYKMEAIPESPVADIPKTDWHEGKSNTELLAMLVSMGIRTEKQMKRSEIVSLIEKKLGDTVEVIDED